MSPQQVSVSPRHRISSLITVTSVAISDQGIACVLGWVMALSAKALDEQYGPGMLPLPHRVPLVSDAIAAPTIAGDYLCIPTVAQEVAPKM